MQPAVLLIMRHCPPPMLDGAGFQKPLERLLTKHAACAALSARARANGTKMKLSGARQLSQNLFLKWGPPGTKLGTHPAPPLSSAPKQELHSISGAGS